MLSKQIPGLSYLAKQNPLPFHLQEIFRMPNILNAQTPSRPVLESYVYLDPGQ